MVAACTGTTELLGGHLRAAQSKGCCGFAPAEAPRGALCVRGSRAAVPVRFRPRSRFTGEKTFTHHYLNHLLLLDQSQI